LRKETSAIFKSFLADKFPGVQVFKITDKTSKMLRDDLAATEVLDESGNVVVKAIPYIDESGRFRDFHSLRHTTGTYLAASGVQPKVAQALMRHSDINLTMSLYTHTLSGQEAEAIAALPDLSAPSSQRQKAVATGTHGKEIADQNYAENLPIHPASQKTIVNHNVNLALHNKEKGVYSAANPCLIQSTEPKVTRSNRVRRILSIFFQNYGLLHAKAGFAVFSKLSFVRRQLRFYAIFGREFSVLKLSVPKEATRPNFRRPAVD